MTRRSAWSPPGALTALSTASAAAPPGIFPSGPPATASASSSGTLGRGTRIRKKRGEDAANPEWIFNERGVGYRMAEPGEL